MSSKKTHEPRPAPAGMIGRCEACLKYQEMDGSDTPAVVIRAGGLKTYMLPCPEPEDPGQSDPHCVGRVFFPFDPAAQASMWEAARKSPEPSPEEELSQGEVSP